MPHAENQQLFEEQMGAGLHCSQCVFNYFVKDLGLNEEFVMKLTSGLGLGVNHGDSCGAITGAILALGLTHGFSDGSESWAAGGIEELSKELQNKFIDRNGSVLCRNLLSGGYDGADENPSSPEGVDPWENCAKYCADAVEIAEEYITAADIANIPAAMDMPKQEQSSVVPIAAGTGIAGLALGAGAAAVITYERRRAENEKLKAEQSKQ
ncbi:MAG: C_GCAxxG_C_C family protein [Eggerthellaceae bacterium]|nr:C_GCAxxG_C_C family protein [Eggerthellaceae bacterium]